MRRLILSAGLAMIAVPAMAHPGEHSPATAASQVPQAEEAAVRSVLSKYKSAIERLDAAGTERLFTADSTVFETGGVEGSYVNYLAHHLGPELKEFKSFRFSDYKVDVRLEGPVALATETYKYRIETNKGETVERLGVATSVLKQENGQWKILSMHNSGRRPKGL